MKYRPGEAEPLLSEGKLLEVLPYVELNGQPFMLPPVVWPVPNWMLGFDDNHPVALPYTFLVHGDVVIPGTGPTHVRVRFIMRLMEDSPGSEPKIGSQVGASDVQAMISVIKGIQ